MPRFVLAAALLAAALAASPSPSSAQMPDFTPVELTQDSAIRSLDALPAAYEVAQRYKNSAAGQGDNMFEGIVGLAASTAARAEFTAVVAPHGFSGYEDWVSVLQSVFHAHAYSKAQGAMQAMGPAMDQAMQQAMQQMMNNPNIPAAQREAILQSMGQANTAVASMKENPPSPNNVAVVTAIEPKIEEVVQYMSNQN